MTYTLYSRKSLIHSLPLFYLKSEDCTFLYVEKILVGGLSFIKDVSKKTGQSNVNFKLYSPVSYEVVQSIYLQVVDFYNLSKVKDPSVNELIKELELILFRWE